MISIECLKSIDLLLEGLNKPVMQRLVDEDPAGSRA